MKKRRIIKKQKQAWASEREANTAKRRWVKFKARWVLRHNPGLDRSCESDFIEYFMHRADDDWDWSGIRRKPGTYVEPPPEATNEFRTKARQWLL